MSEKRASLEVIAPTIEEAVARGLADLGLPEASVEMEVLDEGSRGLFGLGSRQARVRLTIKASPGEEALSAEEVPVGSPVKEATLDAVAPGEPGLEAVAHAQVARPQAETAPVETESVPVAAPETPISAAERQAEQEMILLIARETVEELLDRMKVRAEVTARFGEPDDARSRVPLLVDVHGDDLSILIGPKAETLNALQYITHLIVGKELGRSVPLVVDVEGYRERRALQIRRLARRMAEQAVKSGRRQALEPMPANERRLVHIELRDHPDVTTESVGEDPRRKVTIIPKLDF